MSCLSLCQCPCSPHFGQTKRTAMSICLTLTSELLSESKWAFPLWINWPPHKRFLLLNCWCKQPKLCSNNTFFLSQCYFCRMIFCIFQHFLGNLKSVRFLVCTVDKYYVCMDVVLSILFLSPVLELPSLFLPPVHHIKIKSWGLSKEGLTSREREDEDAEDNARCQSRSERGACWQAGRGENEALVQGQNPLRSWRK